jgi:hypothetical protein
VRATARAGACERVSKRPGLNATMVCRYMTPRNTHDGAPFPHPHGGNGRAFTRRDKAWFRCPVMALIIAGETMQATDHFDPRLPH